MSKYIPGNQKHLTLEDRGDFFLGYRQIPVQGPYHHFKRGKSSQAVRLVP